YDCDERLGERRARIPQRTHEIARHGACGQQCRGEHALAPANRSDRSFICRAYLLAGAAGFGILAIASLQPALSLSECSRRQAIASRPCLSAHMLFMSASQACRMAARAACISGEGAGGACAWTAAADRIETHRTSEPSFM